MTLELLHRLATRTMPIAITAVEEVDAVEVLMLAGHLSATVAAATVHPGGIRSRTATVHGVTRLGHLMLRQFPPPARGRAGCPTP